MCVQIDYLWNKKENQIALFGKSILFLEQCKAAEYTLAAYLLGDVTKKGDSYKLFVLFTSKNQWVVGMRKLRKED